MMSKARKVDHDQNNDEPKIFGVQIDPDKGKIFDRRDFIKAAAAVGATIALTGCNQLDEEEMAKALEETLQAREKEAGGEDSKEEAQPSDTPTSTKTTAPTNTATEVPTETPTSTLTNTPTEIPTDTAVPLPKGEVVTSHSMFEGPQTNHPFIKKTTVGEEVTIIGKTSDGVWFKIVDEDGVFGWCYAEFIKVTSSITIPIIYDIPTPVPTICTCDVYTPCDCDGYSAPPPCSCDAHSTNVCTCDEVCTCDTVHYWYPN
jgi:hypothetical protein